MFKTFLFYLFFSRERNLPKQALRGTFKLQHTHTTSRWWKHLEIELWLRGNFQVCLQK